MSHRTTIHAIVHTRARLIAALLIVAAASLGCVPAPAPSPAAAPMLVDVRVGHHPLFDRVVLELSGELLPHVDVTVATGPVIEEGSGREVSVAGDAVLLVELDPAFGYDPTTWEASYSGPQRIAVTGGVVREVVLVSDFEGRVTWAVGLTHPTSHRIRTASDPTRIAIDLDT